MHTSISRAQIPLTKAVLLLSVAISPTILHGAAPPVGPVALSMPTEAKPKVQAQIVGPSDVKAGVPAVFTLKGLPQEHLDKFNWLVFNKPADAMVLDLLDRQGNPVMIFWSNTKATCAIIADVNVPPNDFQLLVHEFAVGGGGPDPPPKGKYQIVFFHESGDLDNLSKAQRALLSSLVIRKELEKRGHKLLGVYDPDITGPDGLPSRLKGWWQAIKGDKMPRVAFSPLTGGDIWDYPLPEDAAALWKLLEEGPK